MGYQKDLFYYNYNFKFLTHLLIFYNCNIKFVLSQSKYTLFNVSSTFISNARQQVNKSSKLATSQANLK